MRPAQVAGDATTLERFRTRLENRPEWHSVVSLRAGDALIVDNHRVLHYRNTLPSDSKRWLTRYWPN